MNALRPAAAVTVPATCANLGPGFDCLGLALDLRDSYAVQVVDRPGVEVRSSGRDAAGLPTDETHLVASALIAGLERLGIGAPGLLLTCRNEIPQGRGLGSSAAAIVGGIALAYALRSSVEDHRDDILELAAQLEGHPDNVAPAALGGFTVSWTEPDGRARAVRLPVADSIDAVLYVPDATSPTHEARSVLPERVPFADAVHNGARSALLVAALTGRPDLLFPATADRLHQEQRRGAYPAAMALVDRLRAAGVAAVVSGAGPAVLALGAGAPPLAVIAPSGYRAMPIRVGFGVEAAAPTRGSVPRS